MFFAKLLYHKRDGFIFTNFVYSTTYSIIKFIIEINLIILNKNKIIKIMYKSLRCYDGTRNCLEVKKLKINKYELIRSSQRFWELFSLQIIYKEQLKYYN